MPFVREQSGGTTYTHVGTNGNFYNQAGAFSTNVSNLPAGTYLAIAVAGGNANFSNLNITASNGNVEMLNNYIAPYGYGQIYVAKVTLTAQGSIVASVTNNNGNSRTSIILTVMQ